MEGKPVQFGMKMTTVKIWKVLNLVRLSFLFPFFGKQGSVVIKDGGLKIYGQILLIASATRLIKYCFIVTTEKNCYKCFIEAILLTEISGKLFLDHGKVELIVCSMQPNANMIFFCFFKFTVQCFYHVITKTFNIERAVVFVVSFCIGLITG